MATRYARAGGGNWSAAGTWSASSGGGSDGAGINTGDDVILDANSGNTTIDAAANIASIDCTGFTGTLTQNSTLTVSGLLFKFVAGMTYTAGTSARTVTFTSTSGTTTIDGGTKSFQGIILNGSGGTFQLQRNISAAIQTNQGITLTAGTLDLNGFTATVGSFVGSGSTARTLTFGAGTLALTGTLGSIDFSGSNISINKDTGSITISGNTASNRALAVGTAITGGVPAVSIGANTSGGPITVSGTSTIASLAATAPCRLRFTISTTYTITAAPTLSGSSSNRFHICTTTPGSAATISVAAGTATFDNCFLEDMTFSGGATFTATNSYNVANNTGITITEPAGGVVGVIGS